MLDKSFGKNLKAWNEEFARESKLRKLNDKMAFAVKKLDQTKLSSRPVKTHKAESLVDKLRKKSYASISSISENVKRFADNLVNKARNVVLEFVGKFKNTSVTQYGSDASEYQRRKDSERTKGTRYSGGTSSPTFKQ